MTIFLRRNTASHAFKFPITSIHDEHAYELHKKLIFHTDNLDNLLKRIYKLFTVTDFPSKPDRFRTPKIELIKKSHLGDSFIIKIL